MLDICVIFRRWNFFQNHTYICRWYENVKRVLLAKQNILYTMGRKIVKMWKSAQFRLLGRGIFLQSHRSENSDQLSFPPFYRYCFDPERIVVRYGDLSARWKSRNIRRFSFALFAENCRRAKERILNISFGGIFRVVSPPKCVKHSLKRLQWNGWIFSQPTTFIEEFAHRSFFLSKFSLWLSLDVRKRAAAKEIRSKEHSITSIKVISLKNKLQNVKWNKII